MGRASRTLLLIPDRMGRTDEEASAIKQRRECNLVYRHAENAVTRYSYEKFLKDLSVRIKHLRKERGLTLRDMVVTHGFHLTHWQSFESGKRGIAVPSLLRIAEVFGMRLNELLGDSGELPAEVPKPATAATAPLRKTSRSNL